MKGAEERGGPEGREWPGTLVVAVLLAGSGALHLLIEAALPASRQIGSGYPPYLLLAAGVEGAAVAGLLLRKRWGLMAYGSFFPFHQLAILTVSTWGVLPFAVRVGALAAMIQARFHLE